MSFNHVNDINYFNDAIAEFHFKYKLFIVSAKAEVDDYGKTVKTYTETYFIGSIQSNGTKLNQSKSGNTYTKSYNFYCRSIYQLHIGDIVEYQNNYLMVTEVNDYNEWGVRKGTLEMIQLSAYRDFSDYLNYMKGNKLV